MLKSKSYLNQDLDNLKSRKSTLKSKQGIISYDTELNRSHNIDSRQSPTNQTKSSHHFQTGANDLKGSGEDVSPWEQTKSTKRRSRLRTSKQMSVRRSENESNATPTVATPYLDDKMRPNYSRTNEIDRGTIKATTQESVADSKDDVK